MNQLTLEQPSAVTEAIEAGIASGAMPINWMSWIRTDETKKDSVETLVRKGLAAFEAKRGRRADTVKCSQHNVELLTDFPDARVMRASNNLTDNYFLIGRGGL